MTHFHFDMGYSESTFSKYAFGRGEGVTQKEYAVYARENDDNYGRPLNSRFFLASSRFPIFHLKCPAFFAYFEFEKMRSMRSAQRQLNSEDSATSFQCSAKLIRSAKSATYRTIRDKSSS